MAVTAYLLENAILLLSCGPVVGTHLFQKNDKCLKCLGGGGGGHLAHLELTDQAIKKSHGYFWCSQFC